ncbi:MAG: hypothetical protein KJN70_14735 [Eudoraea sp.]|nr:hypothetical protein [Eudoraea sp.]
MQTISKYFVALLLSLFSNYVDNPPSETSEQAGIHETCIKPEKRYNCNSLKTHVPDLTNYI